MSLCCQVDTLGVAVGEAGGRIVLDFVPMRGIGRRSARDDHDRSIRGHHEGPVRGDEDHHFLGFFERTDRQLEGERGRGSHRDADLPRARIFEPVSFDSVGENVARNSGGSVDSGVDTFQHGILLDVPCGRVCGSNRGG